MSCRHEDLQLYSEYGFDNTAIFECMKCGKLINIKKEKRVVDNILSDNKVSKSRKKYETMWLGAR